jgi:hypothetical protein
MTDACFRRRLYRKRNYLEGLCKRCPQPRSPESAEHCETHRVKHAAEAHLYRARKRALRSTLEKEKEDHSA